MKFEMADAVTRAEALALMKEHWQFTPGSELIPLERSLGRVTARALTSRNTLPVVRSSCFDGVAVRASDFANGMPDTSGWVKGRDFVRADTGDDFPDEFDAIIAIEDVILEGEGLRLREGYVYDPEEKLINPSGSTVKAGALLVPAHTRIAPEHLACLAMGGVSLVPVLKKMKVAFLPTGTELVPPGTTPRRGQNVETNGLMLKALLGRFGAEVLVHPIVRDDAAALESALDEVLPWADMVLINGGSSRGEEDFNSDLLRRRGSFFRHGVKAVPGRPIGFAAVEGRPVINVPGPVAAAYQAAHWFLSALVCHYYGLPAPVSNRVEATLTVPVKKRPGFELFSRVALRRTAEGYVAFPVSKGEDGLPGLLRDTDAFLIVPAESSGLAAGTKVSVELLKAPELIREA